MMYNHIGVGIVMDLIEKEPPLSVLDIGPGFGFWGYMVKAYLDLEPYITGVEINPNCVSRLKRLNLYDRIWTGDASDLGEWSKDNYDLAVLSHVIEHLETDEAIQLIAHLKTITHKIIIICPEGDALVQHEQPGYSHLSQWTASDFRELGFKARSVAFSHRAGRVVSLFERLYFKLKGLKRGGVVIAHWTEKDTLIKTLEEGGHLG
jgi:phospholipid N-methyltransferase